MVLLLYFDFKYPLSFRAKGKPVNNVRLCAALLLCGTFGQRASAQTLIGTQSNEWEGTMVGLGPCPNQIVVTVSVNNNLPGQPGNWQWDYAVQNTGTPTPITYLEIDFSQSLPEIANTYVPSGWQGAFHPDSLVLSATNGLAQGQTMHFGFTTLPRLAETLQACDVDGNGNPTSDQCGYSSFGGPSPNLRPRRGRATINRQGSGTTETLSPDEHTPRPQDHGVCSSFQTGEVAAPGSAMGPQAIDPVPDLVAGAVILTDPESLATLGTPVTGITADQASVVVLRIPAANVGDMVTLTLFNDQTPPAQSTSVIDDGELANVDSADPTRSSQIQVTAVNTNEGPMAFAVYFSPTEFTRQNNTDDSTAYQRMVYIQAEDQSDQTSTQEEVPLTILRPPVFLLHGLWSGPSSFALMEPALTSAAPIFCPAACIARGDYSFPTAISNPIPSSFSVPPGPDVEVPTSVAGSALGFMYNAPLVLSEIQAVVVDFRATNNAAATQVDVVAHSMGGDITRTLPTLSGYKDSASFEVGSVHKLITIGTPHLGSPIATQLFQAQNACAAGWFGGINNWSLLSAVAGGLPASGAVGDLQAGSGTGTGIPTAMISSAVDFSAQTSLGVAPCIGAAPGSPFPIGCGGALIHSWCPSSPLAQDLAPGISGWPTVFGGAASDGIVPVASQEGVPGGVVKSEAGMLHASSMRYLGFSGAAELDADAFSASISIVNDIIILLNTPWETFSPSPLSMAKRRR